MRERSHHHRNLLRSGREETSDLENEFLAPVEPQSPVALRPPVRPLAGIEDRRRWVPAASAPSGGRDFLGREARLDMSPKKSARPLSRPRMEAQLRKKSVNAFALSPEVPIFRHPRSVNICRSRQMRREVLFAIRKTGKGVRTRKRRNIWSAVECR